jgi:Tryptophan-associated transmembrane protein (Trp_oprn_chp)
VVAAIGALLVLLAQFIPLYHVHVSTSSAPVKTVGTGANHGWAPVPIALVCFALAAAVYRHGNRTALLGLAVLGVATLLIALLGDLPDAHATGLIGSSASTYVQGVSSPGVGLYLETLGAVLLIVSGGVGFLMLGSAPGRTEPSDRIDRSSPGRIEPSARDDGEPPVPDPGESPSEEPNAPQSPKGPLSLRDTGRRKWSAS